MGRESAVVTAMAKAREGVDFSPRTGATCPVCGRKKLRVVRTMPWDGAVLIRYHRCTNPVCVLCRLGQNVKSIQSE